MAVQFSPPNPVMTRFWKKVDKREDDECWQWTGYLMPNGYGNFHHEGRTWLAHRLAYLFFVGELDRDLQIDHICRNRACVNPRHLELVTHRENNARGSRAQRTHCPYGHPYSPENTYYAYRGQNRMRKCRECQRTRNRAAKRRRKEARS